MIDETYPLKLLLFNAIEGALLGNQEDMQYLLSDECKLDCQALVFDYENMLQWVKCKFDFITLSELTRQYKISRVNVIKHIDKGLLPAIRESWRGKQWRYLIPISYITYKMKNAQ